MSDNSVEVPDSGVAALSLTDIAPAVTIREAETTTGITNAPPRENEV
jgi:hypothetical protein